MPYTESGIYYPDGTTILEPLESHFQQMAESVDSSLDGASAKMDRRSPQALPNNAGTAILWDATTYTRGGAITSAAGIQVPTTGLYDVAAQVAVGNSGAAGFVHLSISGASEGTVTIVRNSAWSSDQPTIITGALRISCTAGNILSVVLFHTNGASISTISTTGGGPYKTALSVSWAGAL